MKTYDDKKNALLDMAGLYLDSLKERPNDIDSISFLILKALILPNDTTNIYAQDIEIDDETKNAFVDMVFNKVSNMDIDLDKKGKIVLDDAKDYYNIKYNNISVEKLNKIAQKLGSEGFHI